MKEVKLPSGAILKITPAPFADAKALYQAFMDEARTLHIDPHEDMDINFFKNLVCTALASLRIEQAIFKCLERCTYKDLKIIPNETFEPIEARGDYIQVCVEVTMENILPFLKNLYASYKPQLEKVLKDLK